MISNCLYFASLWGKEELFARSGLNCAQLSLCTCSSLYEQWSEKLEVNKTLGVSNNILEKSMHLQIKITKGQILPDSQLVSPSALHYVKTAAKSCRISLVNFCIFPWLLKVPFPCALCKTGQQCWLMQCSPPCEWAALLTPLKLLDLHIDMLLPQPGKLQHTLHC